MAQDCSGHIGGLCSSENKSLLQTSVALCMLDASEAYLEPQYSEVALPCDNAVHKYQGKELARVESVLPWASACKTVFKRSGGCYMTFQEMLFPFETSCLPRNHINNIEMLVCSLKTKFSQKKDNKIKLIKAKTTQTQTPPPLRNY